MIPASRSETVLDTLDVRASHDPNRIAFRFLENGERESARLTFGQLHRRARSIAAALSRCGQPGDRALLLYPPGLEFIAAFYGCLYAGIVAVPLYAPHPRRPDRRLASVASDCAPTLVLSDRTTLTRCHAVIDRERSLASAQLVATNEIDDRCVKDGIRQPVRDLAFLQYTSGSTAQPRGAMVTHANLLANSQMIQRAMGLGADSVSVSWLPTHHDMGLIGDTLQMVFSGATSVKMSPSSFLLQPRRWLAAVGAYRATIIGAPNFAFDLCVRRVPEAERASLDLSSLRVTYSGAEPVRAPTLAAFAEAFRTSRFDPTTWFPCYGLAEATLMATGGPHGRGARVLDVSASALGSHRIVEPRGDDATPIVSCGRATENSEVVIVDPNTQQPCQAGAVGEIWIRGPHVAAGYWNNPLMTAETMEARLGARGPFLRTGDLGFIDDGDLFVTGRLKDLIIVHGCNHYAHDLEHTARGAHPLLADGYAAAFGIDSEESQQVVVVQEIARTASAADAAEARRAIVAAIGEAHMVTPSDVLIVPVGTVPKTSSGKVRRAAAREGYLSEQFAPLFPPQTAAVAAGALR